ncbi:MAG: hypothetical protein CBB72_008680 [Muricauda sp. TMED12]|nr:MAG: hypothetical protein CBB72_008680 [Muricauda sp. TMED12]
MRMEGVWKKTLVVTFIFIGFLSLAQTKGDFSFVEGQIPFEIFVTRNDSLTINDILKDTTLFAPITDHSEKTHPKDIFWIRLDLGKELPFLTSGNTWYLVYNSFDHAELFYWGNQMISKKAIGRFDNNTAGNQIKSAKYFSETRVDSNYIINGRYLFLKTKRVLFIENLKNWKFGYTKVSIKDLLSWNDTEQFLYSYIFVGIAGLMTIIILVFFGYFRRWEFLMYSLYTMFMLIYAIKDEYVFFHNFLPNNPLFKVWLFEDITFFIGIAYLLFALFYLNLKKEDRFLYYIALFSIYLHIIFLLVDFAYYFFDNYMAHIHLMKVLPIWDSIFSTLFVVYVLIKTKKLVYYLFVLGVTPFMIGTGVHFYLKGDADPMGYYNKVPLYIGSTIEIIIFAFALIYKLFLEHIERLNFEQEALLNKNKALMAQISPHFIFNALASIQHLILTGKNSIALNYLRKFSRLARNVLESSIELYATLEEETKMLKDYLELESLRFDNAFSYTLEIEEQLAIDEIEIPFMISQPFVENAILHGLLPKKQGVKKLHVSFKKSKNAIMCIIDDTGIGRNSSNQPKRPYGSKRKSRGLNITIARLEFWQFGSGEVEIIDKFDNNKASLGTKVIITIPIK